MLFSLVVFLMVVLVGAFWTYQGFFSALIMFFEAVIACMLAFGFFEPVAALADGSLGGPGIEQPVSFMVIFLAALGIMRTATDKLIHGTVAFPPALDRAGAAVAGFFAGMIIIGSALTAIQMFPIGSAMFGFERYSVDANGRTRKHTLGVVRPDEFVCWLVSALSNDRFGGDVRFSEAKPNYIQSLYASRAVPASEERIFVKPGDIKVNAMWQVSEIDKPTHGLEDNTLVRNFVSQGPESANTTLLVCNVSINKGASGEKANGEIRFRLPQFRLVGPPRKDGVGSPPSVYLACGMTDIYTHRKHGPTSVTTDQRKRLCLFGPMTDFILGDKFTNVVSDGDSFKFDVAFEVPPDFQPWYLEFKRGGRVDLSGKKVLKEPPSYASRPLGQGGKQGKVKRQDNKLVGAAPGGALHVADAIEERTGVSDEIPIPLEKNDPVIAKHLVQGKLGGDDCQFWYEPKPYVLEPSDRVEKFSVPSDKRMVQIGAEVLKQSNMYSRAIGFANRVTAQIQITDSEGNSYFAVGQYAAVEIEGTYKIEIQYYPNAEVPERCLKKPTKVTHSLMTKAGPEHTRFGYLFLVPPGVKIVSFNAGSGKSQELDIEVPN